MRDQEPTVRSQLLRAILESVDDSGPQQLMKLSGLAGQTIGEAVRSQHFGLTSVPPAGAEALMLALGGGFDRAHALGVEHPQKRPTNLPSGASALYDASGNIIKLLGPGGAVMNFNANGWTLTCAGATITSNGKDIVIEAPGAQVKLGVGTYSPIVTVAGPSSQAQAAL
jgi:phage baseplate assembly protein V